MERDNSFDYQITEEQSRWAGLALPALMRKVYVWMTLALVITGVTAYGVASSENLLAVIYSSKIVMWGIIIAELGLVIAISGALHRMSLATGTLLFILYSVLNGVMLSSVFMLFDYAVIGKVFFITAGTFAAMAFIGYTTKADLSSLGKILIMALIGLVIATVVNMFMKSTGFDLILSYVGVLVFVGLTAYDTQKIKQLLFTQDGVNETSQKIALLGALTLYLDFVNLFLYLLRIFGRSND